VSATLSFLGAAATVTGSCYLVERAGRRLLVDCGLFQGSKTLKELNYGPFPFGPETIDAVFLTHAHIDHSGLVPKLCRAGYRGPIRATAETRDLLTYLLPDCGFIQEFEVERLNQRRRRRGEAPVQPIYTRADGERAAGRIETVATGAWVSPVPGIRARFWPSSHILGAASIELEIEDRDRGAVRVLFSGDVGPPGNTFHLANEAPSGLDYLVVETTYGDRPRTHVSLDERRRQLRDEVRDALAAGGNLIIPAFAVERTQELLVDLGVLFARGEIPPATVFLDSPLAIRATEVFARHVGKDRALLASPHFHFVTTAEESKAIGRIRAGAIILAASGMCEAGRIRHHLAAHLWRPDCTVLLIGYQAPGTLGRLLLDGKEAVRIMGEEVRVAARIRSTDAYSAHADRDELAAWLAGRLPIECGIVLTHGEPSALAAFKALLLERGTRTPILTPPLGAVLSLDGSPSPTLAAGTPRLAATELGEADWHNDYAGFLLALSGALRGARTDAARKAVLARLRSVLAPAP
jgi:metallo-beta-lactamase family protein